MKLSDEQIDLLARCSKDTLLTGKVFFPDSFTSPFEEAHRKIGEALDSGHPRVVIKAPRGIGKTTIVLTHIAKAVLFRQYHYIYYISASETFAMQKTENLKNKLKTSKEVRELFGSIHPKATRNRNVINPKSAVRGWTAFDTFLQPRGAEQQVRGGLEFIAGKDRRPDLLVLDDLEIKKALKNSERRKELLTWFFADPYKCFDHIDIKNGFGRTIYIDTLKGSETLLQRLLDDPDWLSVELSLCGPDLKSTMPHMIPDDVLKRDREMHKRLGILEVWTQEMQGIASPEELRLFKKEYYRYYTVAEDHLRVFNIFRKEVIRAFLSDMTNITIFDPAKTITPTASYTAIITISVSRSSKMIFIRETFKDRVDPDTAIDEFCRVILKYNVQIAGVKSNSLHLWATMPINQAFRDKGISALLEEIPERREKRERIKELFDFYKRGQIIHQKGVTDALEEEQKNFQGSEELDLLDAEADVLYIMNKYGIYFNPMLSGMAADEYDELGAREADYYEDLLPDEGPAIVGGLL